MLRVRVWWDLGGRRRRKAGKEEEQESVSENRISFGKEVI